MNILLDEFENVSGTIFDIQRGSIHDGPGVRTSIFFKGCPLHCLWCHNPESIKQFSELSYNPNMCIGCGECVNLCKNSCHIIHDGKHYFDRKNCAKCFSCTELCYSGALKRIGKQESVQDVMKEVLKDKKYYDMSGGGVTFSGGEPIMQLEFLSTLLKVAKFEGLHVCLDTCGYSKISDYIGLLKYIDIFLYDIKETNNNKHIKFTGVSNHTIIKNLYDLDSKGASIILRCPIIPGLNDRDDHFEEICRIASNLKNIVEINVLPYHPYGHIKGERIGMSTQLEGVCAPQEYTVMKWIEKLRSGTNVKVK
jgi:glycyl-radical enzyme activating protein